MKKLSELLTKCSQFEELASFGVEPLSFEHPTIPRPPLVPMEFRPTELAPRTVPGALWDTAPTDRTPAGPTMRSPEMRPVDPVERPVAPVDQPRTPAATPDKPSAAEPAKPGISAADIKFDENGNVVVPKEWVNEKGKLVVDKKQLAKAVYDARKAKIVSAKMDAARTKTLNREMSQVNSMVKTLAFKEKLPARATIGLLAAAALATAYYDFTAKSPSTTDTTKKQVADAATVGASTSSWQKPNPPQLSNAIKMLKTTLSLISARTRQTQQAVQSYTNMLSGLDASLQKLNTSSLNLDLTASASSYASELQKFDQMAVEAVGKLEKLETAFRNKGDSDGFEKTKTVIDGLEAYIVAINNARSIKAQG